MRTRMRLLFFSLVLLSALTGIAKASDESFAYQFLGSPLVILVGLIVIVGIAVAYHKIRK